MPRLLGCMFGLALITNDVQAQTNPVLEEFNRLMGAPKQVTGMLLDYPWRMDLPAQLPGLRRVEYGPKIRIASVEVPLSDFGSWKRWESEDGDTWVDIVVFKEPYGAMRLESESD